jgi:hypothetical protein
MANAERLRDLDRALKDLERNQHRVKSKPVKDSIAELTREMRNTRLADLW